MQSLIYAYYFVAIRDIPLLSLDFGGLSGTFCVCAYLYFGDALFVLFHRLIACGEVSFYIFPKPYQSQN